MFPVRHMIPLYNNAVCFANVENGTAVLPRCTGTYGVPDEEIRFSAGWNRAGIRTRHAVQYGKNDGWEMEKDFDGIFVPASNSKYDGADLCLYGRKNPVTVDDLSSGGVWGYDIDIAYCGTSQFPAFSIGGITWGASADDVKSVFGTPGDEISTSFYSSVMTYELQDGTEVEFKVTENNEYGINGLVGVSVVNYGLIE